MPWVPIHESGVSFHLDEGGDAGVYLDGSTVTAEDAVRPNWRVVFGDSVRLRVTAVSYQSGGGCPWGSPAWLDDVQNVAVDPMAGWEPVYIERDGYISIGYEAAQGGECPVVESFQFLIEVWAEGELVANDDEATTSADTPVTVDVLANDTFNDEPVTLDQLEGPPTIDQQPANGTVSVAPDGKITYTPNPGFAGTDEFVYRIATPEPPEPSVICGFFGEGFAVISVPEGFSLDEPITFSVGDQSMEMFWAPWGGRWEPNFDDNYFYPQEGELAVMSQGGNSVEGNLVRGFVLTYAYGQVWMVGPEAPWFEFFVETEDGNTYYAMDNGGNYFAFTDEQPPIPPPGSPYPVKISYQDEVDDHEFCGLMVTPTD